MERPSFFKNPFIGLGLLVFIFIWWAIATYFRHSMDFNGVVQSVTYDIQKAPTVVIDGQTYPLGHGDWDDSVLIEKGDRLIKKIGDMHLLLIKQNTKDTIDLLTDPQKK